MRTITESKILSEKEKALLERCKKAVKIIDSSAEIILYGSRARGSAQKDSDYDLLILVDGDVNLEKEDIICRGLYPIEMETMQTLSAFVFSRKVWDSPLYQSIPLYQNVEREGIIL